MKTVYKIFRIISDPCTGIVPGQRVLQEEPELEGKNEFESMIEAEEAMRIFLNCMRMDLTILPIYRHK